MELVVDVGNQRTKVAWFINNGIHKKMDVADTDADMELNVLAGEKIDRAIVSTVRNIPEPIVRVLQNISQVIQLDHATPIPIINRYESKETLGNDRLAGVVGAAGLYPGQNNLVIDAGTCITYDFINSRNEYLGGNISPGLQTRYMALNKFTGRLPLIDHRDLDQLYGNTTETSILTGVFNGFVREVNATIEAYKTRLDQLNVILCGGEAIHLVNHINSEIFANQNLVLLGLHKILLHNG